MTQLALLDEFLQAEFARPAHWAEPRSKIRTSQRPVQVDYRAWLEHAADCERCTAARDDLVALRDGSLEWEPRVPCRKGLPLLPLVDVDAAAEPMDRQSHAEALRRFLAFARELHGWGAAGAMNAGQAWTREPEPNRHEPRAGRAG